AGTRMPSAEATFWISSASCFCFARSVARAHWTFSSSMRPLSGQPNHALSPAPEMPAWTAGLITSEAIHHVNSMFHPPCCGGSFFARRATTDHQSIPRRSTFKPPWLSRWRAGRGFERPAAREERGARLVVLLDADGRFEILRLVHDVEQRLPRLLVVEGRMLVVRTDPALGAARVGDERPERGVGLDLRHEVERRVLPPVHLAGVQRRVRRGVVGDVAPDDT